MTKPTFKNFKEKALNNPVVRDEYEASAAAFVVKRKLIALRHQTGLKTNQMTELKSEAAQARHGDFEAFLDAVPDVEVGIETDRIE